MIARGRLRCGLATSPDANDRSAQPSYAQSTLTSARPVAPRLIGPVDAAARCAAVAPWAPPRVNAASTSSVNAPNFAQVATPTIIAPTLAPAMFAAAAKAIAPADSPRESRDRKSVV